METRPVNMSPFYWNKEVWERSRLCQHLAICDQVGKTTWTFLNHFDHGNLDQTRGNKGQNLKEMGLVVLISCSTLIDGDNNNAKYPAL